MPLFLQHFVYKFFTTEILIKQEGVTSVEKNEILFIFLTLIVHSKPEAFDLPGQKIG